MPEHHTNDSESSSLPTPTTQDSSGLCRDHGGDLLHELICGCPRADRKDIELLRTPSAIEGDGGAVSAAKKKQLNRFVMLRDQIQDMLPTPLTTDWKNGRSSSGYGPNLPETARNLIPTPTTRDYKDGTVPHERNGKIQTDTVARAVINSGELTGTEWGKFGPAIERWEETTGRPAPDPTKPDGKDGNRRLSSKFTEWMMGLPDGWITGHGLKRNEELKLAGNGVVPQQAELALRILLKGIPLPTTSKQINLPTPTVSDTFTDNLRSTQQKDGSMHSVTLPQAVKMIKGD
jgi:hypothetical protein